MTDEFNAPDSPSTHAGSASAAGPAEGQTATTTDEPTRRPLFGDDGDGGDGNPPPAPRRRNFFRRHLALTSLAVIFWC